MFYDVTKCLSQHPILGANWPHPTSAPSHIYILTGSSIINPIKKIGRMCEGDEKEIWFVKKNKNKM